MSTLLTTSTSTSAETLELRICRGAELFEQFFLPEGKCTIGSSPSCQVRLESSAVRPLQCLVVRKGSEVTVTRWAAGLLLNDGEFTTATLRFGDRLSVGEFELKLLDPASPSQPATSEPSASVEEKSVALIDKVAAQVAAEVDFVEEVQQTKPPVVETLGEVPPSLEADLSKLHAANQQARQRFRKLIGTLRELREESHGLDQHVNVLTEQLQTAKKSQESLTAELQQVQAVAAERESQFAEELDRAIAELSTSYEKSNVLEQQWQGVREQNETLQSEFAALHAKMADFDQVRIGWNQEKQQLEAELLTRENELTQLLEELHGIKAFYEASFLELQHNSEAQQQRLAATIEQREHEIAQLHQGLEDSVTELHQQNESLREHLAQLTSECEQYQLQANSQAGSLASLTETNAALQSQLDNAAADYDRQRGELESRLQAAVQAAAEAQLKSETPDPALEELEAELGVVRKERQKLAEDNHRINEQIAEAEKRIQLLEIDVRSANAEWQRAQVTVTKLQDACLTAEAHAADLDAKLADLANFTAVEHASECDHFTGELTNLKQQLSAKEAELADFKEQRDLLLGELANHRLELTTREAGLVGLQEERDSFTRQLTDLKQQLAAKEAEVVELHEKRELAGKEVGNLKQDFTAKESVLAELKIERDQAVSLLSDLQHELMRKEADLAASEQLLTELQTSATDKNQTEEAFATELMLRDSRIEELAAELRFAQDQLADCAAQGERLNDLYQQAQVELATLATATPTPVPVAEETLVSLPISDDLPPQSPAWPEEDPRDDDESRIVRALVSATAVAEPEEQIEEVEREEFQPASFIDRYSHIFDENGEASQDETSRVDTTIRAEPDSLLDCGDDSAALEAYMANMMRRVRGESSSEAITPPLSKPVQKDETSQFSNPIARMNTLTKRVAAVPALHEGAEPAEGLIDLKELKGTSQKPPLPTSLSAMRELANISARQAIAKHRKRRHFEGALSKLLVSGIAGGTAAYMLLTADKITSPYFMAGCGVAIVSGFWGFKLLGILLEMIRDGINDEHLPAELDDSETALPIDSPAE